MASQLVTPDSTPLRSSRFQLVAWVNKLLQTKFMDVRQFGSGAVQCQILDSVIPGSVDLTQVRFAAQSEEDCTHNFSILQDSLSNFNIPKTFPVPKLIKGELRSNLETLRWFQAFYMANESDEAYDAVKARNKQDIVPLVLENRSPGMDSEPDLNGSGKKLYNQRWEEEFSWVEQSPLGKQYSFCRVCHKNLKTAMNGVVDLKRHQDCKSHSKKLDSPKAQVHQPSLRRGSAATPETLSRGMAEQEEPEEDASEPVGRSKTCSHLGVEFIKKHSSPPHNYQHEFVTSMGERNPYCLYLYDGQKLDSDLEVAVILVGFLDLQKSRQCVRFLDAVESPTSGAAVVAVLEKFHLSTDDLVALHLSDEKQAAQEVCSHLWGINPNIVVPGHLRGLADAACDAGVQVLSAPVRQLIDDLHAHHLSTSHQILPLQSVFDSKFLSKEFSGLSIHLLLSRILAVWGDLLQSFRTCEDSEKVQHIRSQLQNPEIQATFIFLEQALKPLHRLQDSTEAAADVELPLIYRGISDLLSTFASRFLHQSAATRFLDENNVQILQNNQFHLTDSPLSVCGKAVEDFLEKSKSSELLPLLQERALSFYIATTSKISEELPVSAGLLKSIGDLLDPMSWRTVTVATVRELGTKVGVCCSPKEALQLARDFEEVRKDEPQAEERKNGHASVSLGSHWASILKETTSKSLFRRLVLTLLCLPCPPPDTSLVFTQALQQPSTTDSSGPEAPVSVRVSNTTWSDSRAGLPSGPRCPQGFFPCEVVLNRLDESLSEIEGLKVCWEVAPRGRPTRSCSRKEAYQDGRGFGVGELVWGKLKGFSWWPGLVMPWKTNSSPAGIRRVEWFGDGMFSEIYTEKLLHFRNFRQCFCKNSFASLPIYKDAMYQILELAGERAGKSFSEAGGDRAQEMRLMVDWALHGFLPKGPAGFSPPGDSSSQADSEDSSLSDYQPPAKRKYALKSKSLSAGSRYCRELIRKKLKDGLKIEKLCLPCGSTDVVSPHPIFQGGLCLKCKENFTETLFRYDEDGYQSYCTICCAGMEVVLCDNPSCCRCFCKDCLDILVQPGTFDLIKQQDPWHCFICKPSQCQQELRLRPDWSVRVQDFFANDSAFQFEPHRLYPCIPAHQRRPLRVLSLFDGIATGYLVLKDLGFNIERYIASEICEDSIAVGMIKHEGRIQYVNDVRTITRKHLAEWGPFDLLIGGSPCNDLSMVNPLRKGLFEGTGRLFFEFYRILTLLKPKEEEERPFFWLFENVVFMSANDKADICRFLECNPILIDAIKVSPAHRARYFWGNLPGMNRPVASSLDDKVILQDCLEVGRVAKFDKVRTITTKSNSIRQGKTGPLPVSMNGREDYLWCTEMEQVFGFPKHYTDVNNMGRAQRQKVLGRSWSVPVIRHLFAPLKDYYQCQS
ncbi:uncharacterized protein LOC128749555 [Synchiropus splendidus]|uniref:uncharacterized protein LOC128749555 n=1 Tax=Synchiropus splendidus TaxID=270530 RepID=UPI00237EBD96|nr:uncharacterized protein LOC128749555 [Synchiropus splendidus]